MGSREAVEAVVVVLSLGGFVAYHVWLFYFRGGGEKVKAEYNDFFQAGKLARSIWAEACATDEKDAILGVQQARNAMSACTYLATISVALATAGITIIFDENKMQRIYELAIHDPMMRHLEGGPLVPPIAIIGTALGALYCGFICFAQSVRLYVHTGFYIRACTSRFNPGTLTVAEAKRVTIRAGLAFSFGLRLFYLFIPLVMWSMGVTSLLISSVVMTSLIAYMDHFDMPTLDEQQAADDEVLERLTNIQQPSPTAAAADGSRRAVELGLATALSGVTSRLREGEDSNHPEGLRNHQQQQRQQQQQQHQQQQQQQQQISLAQQSRRTSAAQELSDEFVHNMV